jgi:hypothetical protein
MQETDLREIVAWLDAGDAADYQAGMLLLQRHFKNRALVAHLLRKESASNREKLAYELVKTGCGGNMGDVHEVLNHYAQAVQGAVQQVATVLVEAHHPGVPAFPEQPAPTEVPEAARPDVDAITELMSRLFKERVQLSNSLADLDPAAAPAVVKQILSLQDQYNVLAVKRRNLAEQPAAEPCVPSVETIPEQPTVALTVDRAALLQQRGNLRSNISKAKGKLEKAQTDAKKVELEEKIVKLQAELSSVDLQLASPQ